MFDSRSDFISAFRFPLVRRIVFALAAALLLALRAAPASAHGFGLLLMDADSGQVLHAVNPDEQNHPASLTKMMTLYLLFDALESGKAHLHDKMTVSSHAARQSPSKLGLSRGETISVEDAILALITKSANDVAVVVAEHLGGSEPAFAQAMTKKARDLGMKNTAFRNASGLPIKGQWSTPRDMALLARALIKNHAREYHYFATREFEYDGETIPTHNHLLGNYEGADGLKTGYIASSGFNLVASAKRGGHRLIGVVFGGRSPRARDRQMVSLLDYGFSHVIGQPETEVAALDRPVEDSGAATPSTEAEAEDPDVAAVMRAMADAHAGNPAPSQKTAMADQAEAADDAKGGGDVDADPWGVQVGSFRDKGKAERVASAAAKRLGDLVAEGDTEAVPLRRGHRTMYRAVIVGLSQDTAAKACQQLTRHHTACRVVNTQVDLASR